MALKYIFVITLWVSFGSDSFSQEGKELRMLFSDPWPPLIEGELDSDGCGKGVWIELIETIFNDIEEYHIKCSLEPWARVLDGAQKGVNDGVILLGKTEERELYLDYVEWLTINRVVIWYSTERFPNGLEWDTINDFVGLKIGKIRQSINGKEFDIAKKNGLPLEIYETVYELQLYKMILAGRIDIAAIPELIADHAIKKNGWEGRLMKMKKPLAEDRLYFAFSKKSGLSKLIPKINSIIINMRNNGIINKILSGK